MAHGGRAGVGGGRALMPHANRIQIVGIARARRVTEPPACTCPGYTSRDTMHNRCTPSPMPKHWHGHGRGSAIPRHSAPPGFEEAYWLESGRPGLTILGSVLLSFSPPQGPPEARPGWAMYSWFNPPAAPPTWQARLWSWPALVAANSLPRLRPAGCSRWVPASDGG